MVEITYKHLEEIALKGLEHALKSYNNVGIPLSYTPKLCYVDYSFGRKIGEVSPFKEQALAQEYLKNRIKEIRKNEYSKKEIDRKNKIDIMKILTNAQEDVDIFLFKKFKDILSELDESYEYNFSCEVMAHEVWHLIEMEKIPKDTNYLVREGTAYYAGEKIGYGNYTKNRDSFRLNDSNFKLFNFVYKKLAPNIVYNHVDSLENPFKSLLEPKIRKKIHNNLDKTLKVLLGEWK
jgi:hypothetical protein